MRRTYAFSQHSSSIAPLLLALFLVSMGSACGDDTGPTSYTLYVTANPSLLTHEGSASSTISVRVLDQNNRPAESGLQLMISARDSANEASGRFGTGGAEREVTFLDTAGAAQTSFVCTDEGDVRIIAQLQTGEFGMAAVDCRVLLDGGATITRLYADRQRISPDTQVDIYAETEGSDGSPLAQGVSVRFEITDGHGGLGPAEATEFGTNTGPDGIARTQFLAGPSLGETTIVASFTNQSVGAEPSDPLVIVIDPDAPDEPGVLASAAHSALLADGNAQTTVSATVFMAGGAPAPDLDVNVTTDRGLIRKQEGRPWESAITLTSDSNGIVTAEFQSGTDSGRATLEFCVAGRAFTPPLDSDVCDTTEVRLLSVGSIASRGVEEVPLGIQGSGRNETTPLCFEVRDTLDDIFPQGFTVKFNVSTTSSGGDVLLTDVPTDEQGQACTTVISGSTFGVVSVEPCVEVGAADVCGTPVDVPVTGAVPSRSGMTLACDDVNLGALRYAQGTSIVKPEVGNLCTNCALTLRDRSGNSIGFKYTVTFAAEVGTFPGGAQVENCNLSGEVNITWCADSNMPLDVEPLYEEPYWMDGPDDLNPRDGLVTIIAYVNGEEEFLDDNENGSWDEGEVFWDLSEPFIDADDNNEYNGDLEHERHIDVEYTGHVAGEFDLPNLEWDDDSFIWVQSRILLTGSPEFADYDDGNPNIELDLDDDYNTGAAYRLSHWYVDQDGSGFNVYQSDIPNPSCSSFPVPDYCLSLSRVGASVFELYFVARDMFGNPMNASLEDFSASTNLTGSFVGLACGGLSAVDANVLSPTGDDYPFEFSINRAGVAETRNLLAAGDPSALEQLYRVEISDFPTGSSELFFVSYDGLSPIDCRFEIMHPMQACPDCGDAPDEEPWEFMVLTN